MAGAEGSLQAALRSDPRHVLAHRDLGTLFWTRGDGAGAEESFHH